MQKAMKTGMLIALGTAVILFNSCGKLPMHDRAYPKQGEFSEKPSDKELPYKSAAGKKGEKKILDSLKPKPDTINKK